MPPLNEAAAELERPALPFFLTSASERINHLKAFGSVKVAWKSRRDASVVSLSLIEACNVQ